MLTLAATGHVSTRGADVILGNARDKAAYIGHPDSRPKAAAEAHTNVALFPTQGRGGETQDFVSLRPDPQVYPCEYVSKRRRPTTHELLAFSTLLKINTPSIAYFPLLSPPSLAGLCDKQT
jgi:hypothetical protein